jgi:hypothetical protein
LFTPLSIIHPEDKTEMRYKKELSLILQFIILLSLVLSKYTRNKRRNPPADHHSPESFKSSFSSKAKHTLSCFHAKYFVAILYSISLIIVLYFCALERIPFSFPTIFIVMQERSLASIQSH